MTLFGLRVVVDPYLEPEVLLEVRGPRGERVRLLADWTFETLPPPPVDPVDLELWARNEAGEAL